MSCVCSFVAALVVAMSSVVAENASIQEDISLDTWTSPELLATPGKDVNDSATPQLRVTIETTSLIDTTEMSPTVKDHERPSTLLFTANPNSAIIPSQMTTSYPDALFSHGTIIPSPTIETKRRTASVIQGVTIIDLFAPSSTTPSQTISTLTVLSRATARLTSTSLHKLESASQGPTLPMDKTVGHLTEPSSATPIPNSTPSLNTVTSGADSTTEEMMVGTVRGKGPSDLGKAPLWVWVTVAFVVLAITSCCFILCIVAVSIANKHAKETKQARENRLRSSRMNMIYGDIEEVGQLNTKKKNKITEETVSNNSTDLGWYCRNVNLGRRNSQRTFSTFKPHLSPNEQVAN